MKGKPDLRVPSKQGRDTYDSMTRICGCPLGSRCVHTLKRCRRSIFNGITCTWICDCEKKNWECDYKY